MHSKIFHVQPPSEIPFFKTKPFILCYFFSCLLTFSSILHLDEHIWMLFLPIKKAPKILTKPIKMVHESLEWSSHKINTKLPIPSSEPESIHKISRGGEMWRCNHLFRQLCMKLFRSLGTRLFEWKHILSLKDSNYLWTMNHKVITGPQGIYSITLFKGAWFINTYF